MMTVREIRGWLAGALLLLLVHAAFPRYDWRTVGLTLVRVDRWTGQTTVVLPLGRGGQ